MGGGPAARMGFAVALAMLLLASAGCLGAPQLHAAFYDTLLANAQVLTSAAALPLLPAAAAASLARSQPCLSSTLQADPAAAFEDFARAHSKPYLGDAAEYGRRRATFEV